MSCLSDALNKVTFDGNTVLHLAAGAHTLSMQQHLELVQLLLDHGADSSIKNLNNKTAKDLVCKHSPQVGYRIGKYFPDREENR